MERIQKLFRENERHFLVGALLLGFIVDNLTLSRIDLVFDNAILFSYLTLATIAIILITRFSERKFSRWLFYLLQYAFGGLFSGFIIFYSQSTGFIGSWLFIAILVALFIGNEFFKERYMRTSFQLSILFVALFLYIIFLVPIITGKLGASMFLISGIISIILISFIVWLINALSHKSSRQLGRGFIFTILLLYIIFNTLYFTNIIPPIPLSLKELTIAHHIERVDDGQFLVATQKRPWYKFFNTSDIAYKPGTPLYSFASVFAPTKINTKISHQWSYFDEKKSEWVPVSRIGFSISGGRDEGFRGYTFKEALREGRWRVDVLTERNQLIGRTTFTLTFSSTTPLLTVEYK